MPVKNKNVLIRLVVIYMVLSISGCATVGTNFISEPVKTLLIGKTTKADIINLFGQAGNTEIKTYDNIKYEIISYVYAEGSLSGAKARALVCEFKNDSLNAYAFTSGFEEDQTDYATIKYNSSGVEQWVEHYNTLANETDVSVAMVLDNSGNVYVTGWSVGGATLEYATVKYNSSGEEQWVARYNGPSIHSHAYDITIDGEGNVYVTGGSESSGIGTNDYATVKYNPSGEIMWITRYDGTLNGNDAAENIKVDDSGNVIVAGTTALDNSGGIQFTIIKYQQTITGIISKPGLPKNFALQQNYPNPFNPSTTIEFSIPQQSFVTLKIYDLLGREVASLVNEDLQSGSYKTEFNGINLSSRIYFYRLDANGLTQTKKFILMK